MKLNDTGQEALGLLSACLAFAAAFFLGAGVLAPYFLN